MPTRAQRFSVGQFIGRDHPHVAVVVGVIPALRIRPIHVGREEPVVIQVSDVLLVVIIESRGVLFDAPRHIDGSQIEIVLGIRLSVRAVAKSDGFELLVLFRELNASHASHASLRPHFNAIDLVVNNRRAFAIHACDANIARPDSSSLRHFHFCLH